jgi:hypothetical protein
MDRGGDQVHFRDRLIVIIRRTINTYIGQHFPADPNVKNLRAPSPKKYDGTDDIDLFMNFLKSVLRHMAINGFGGEDFDQYRVMIIGHYLEGKAESWYNKYVDAGIERGWSFEAVILELFKRFIHTATAGKAWHKYDTVDYDPKEGVKAFYDELMEAADHLPQRPTETELARRFMKRLPDSIITHLHNVHSVTVESTSFA